MKKIIVAVFAVFALCAIGSDSEGAIGRRAAVRVNVGRNRVVVRQAGFRRNNVNVNVNAGGVGVGVNRGFNRGFANVNVNRSFGYNAGFRSSYGYNAGFASYGYAAPVAFVAPTYVQAAVVQTYFAPTQVIQPVALAAPVAVAAPVCQTYSYMPQAASVGGCN